MEIFYHIYIFLALICLLFSLIIKETAKRKFWVYFLIVIVTDLYMYYGFKYFLINIHPYAIVFYNLFFIWYFREIFNKSYKIVFLISVIVFLFILIKSENPYDFKIILSMFIVFLFLPLIWLTKQLNKIDGISILKKHMFWVSASMMFWIIVFAFKMAPLYFLQLNDKEFLLQIDTIFQFVNILFYIVLLKSIFCKF